MKIKIKKIFTFFLLLLIIFTIIQIIFLLNKNISIENFTNNKISNNLQIYCINLDSNKDRWQKIQNYINKNNIAITRFPAFNGKSLNKQELINKNILDPNSNMGPGQIGCFYSHLNVMHIIKNQDKDYGLILEDDVILPDNLLNIIDDLGLSYFPDDFDIIFLGGCNIKGKKYNEKLIIPTDNYDSYNLCCHAMLFKKSNINKVIDILTPMNEPIDNQLRNHFDNGKLKVFYVNPNIINQNKELISVRRVIDGKPQSDFWKKNHMNISVI